MIKTDKDIEYSIVNEVEKLLIDQGYKLREREKVTDKTNPEEVYSLYSYEVFKTKPEGLGWVDILFHYNKNFVLKTANSLRIDLVNDYGYVVPKIKAEIDKEGDLIYNKLVNLLDKESVKIERVQIRSMEFVNPKLINSLKEKN